MIEYQYDTDQGLVNLYEYDLPDNSRYKVYKIPYKITRGRDLVATVDNVSILRTIPKLRALITEKIQEILLAAKARAAAEQPFKVPTSNYSSHTVFGYEDELEETDPATAQDD